MTQSTETTDKTAPRRPLIGLAFGVECWILELLSCMTWSFSVGIPVLPAVKRMIAVIVESVLCVGVEALC